MALLSRPALKALGAGIAALAAAASASPVSAAAVLAPAPAPVSSPAPHRIVTLMPSLGELAYELSDEPETRIVGVSEFTTYPPALKKKPTIGPYFKVNLERVLALHPDLVIASTEGNARDQVDHLRELKLNVLVVDTGSLAQIEASMRQVAHALSQDARGERMALKFASGVAEFRRRAVGRAPRKVVLQLGDEPLIVAGGKSFLTEALATIGARNPYADSPTGYPRPALEDLLARKPDLVLVLAMGSDRAPFARMRESWKKLPAAIVDADTLTLPTLRLLEGLRSLERAVYGAP